MAAAGTLLQDLDSTSGGDNDLVQKILSDMNVQSAPGHRPIPPAMPAQTPMAEQRMAPGNSQFTMDSTIPTSHMIGNQHPSPADFAAAVAGARPQEAMYTMPVGVMPGAGPVYVEAPQKKGMSWLSGFLLDELKTPLLVAILFFLFSLPPMRIVISHYIPSIVKQTGEYSTVGLALVSLILAATFWLLQRVVAPLLSL
uniref:Uncharacterized protein n=1 Tax=viral metagenome TaxID=1070528 RepID=A0A6C0L8F4_9ZZZZ